MQAVAETNDSLAQFISAVAALSAQVGDPALAGRLGPNLVMQVQGIAAAVRQRYIPTLTASQQAAARH